MAKGMGLTRRAMIALAGLGGMVAGGRIFGTAAARRSPRGRTSGSTAPCERCAKRSSTSAKPPPEPSKSTTRGGPSRRYEVAIRQVEEMMR